MITTKSGHKTYGVDWFFSSWANRPVKGLAFFALSLVGLEQRQSYPLRIEQVKKPVPEAKAAKSSSFSWGLNLFFNKYEFNVDVKPLHEDKCSGLKRIGDVGMIFNYIFFLIGIYLSLKVIDKLVIQEVPLTNDIGNPILLGFYIFLAPFLFLLPLWAPHKIMKSKKKEFIRPLIMHYSERIYRIQRIYRIGEEPPNEYEELEQLDTLIQKLNKDIPVWPFDFKSWKSFLATVVFPSLPVILPFLGFLGKAIFERLKTIN